MPEPEAISVNDWNEQNSYLENRKWKDLNGKISTTIGHLGKIAEALGVKTSAFIKF